MDDDQAVLDGFGQMLKLRSADWDIYFAHAAALALGALEARPFDVVIADKKVLDHRTSFMDKVRIVRPDAVRIMFSDKMDVEATMRSVVVKSVELTASVS